MLRQQWNVRCDVDALKEFLAPRDPESEERLCDEKNVVTRVVWTESDAKSWGGQWHPLVVNVLWPTPQTSGTLLVDCYGQHRRPVARSN